MQHIIVDLEFAPVIEKPVSNLLKNEIIEIGAVRLNDKFEIEDVFDVYVKPEFAYLNKKINKLTGICDTSVNDAPSLQVALEMFMAWIGTENFKIYQWSYNDKKQIVDECIFKQLESEFSVLCKKHWRDIQRLYQRVFEVSHLPSLASAIENLSVDFEGKMHRACDDAKNTAYVLQTMVIEEKYIAAVKQLKEIVEAKQQHSTLGDLLGIDIGSLYSICDY